MRKILLLVIIVLELYSSYHIVAKGTVLYPSYKEITGKQDNLKSKMESVSKIDKDILAATTNLSETKKQYEQKSNQYNQSILENKKLLTTLKTDKYRLEFLLIYLGNYANESNIEINIDIKDNELLKRKDLLITLNGNYIGIINFINQIEKELLFKVDDLTMNKADSKIKCDFYIRNLDIQY